VLKLFAELGGKCTVEELGDCTGECIGETPEIVAALVLWGGVGCPNRIVFDLGIGRGLLGAWEGYKAFSVCTKEE
jgi:hypothetical protein